MQDDKLAAQLARNGAAAALTGAAVGGAGPTPTPSMTGSVASSGSSPNVAGAAGAHSARLREVSKKTADWYTDTDRQRWMDDWVRGRTNGQAESEA